MTKMSTKEKTVDNIILSIKEHLKDKFDITVADEKVKGLAFSALREAGMLKGNDKYKTYDHIGQILKMMNDSFKLDSEKDLFQWEDVESLTGNLFYAMKVATKRPLDEISVIIQRAQKPETKMEDLIVDLFFLEKSIKKNMTDTWAYLEKTQKVGVGIFVSKVLSYIVGKLKNEKQS